MLKNAVAITPAGSNHYNNTRKLMWLLKLYLTFCGFSKKCYRKKVLNYVVHWKEKKNTEEEGTGCGHRNEGV